MRNRNPHRDRSDARADERPWWEEVPGDSVFDRPSATGRRADPWAARSTAQAARDLWSNAPTRADHWGPDTQAESYRDPWPPDPRAGGGARWEPDQRTSPAYQPQRYAPPSGYTPPAGGSGETQRTAVWPAPPYADEPGPEPRAERVRRPRYDDDGPGSRSRRRRRDRADRDRRGFPFGFGALVGLAGLGCFLAALLVLPWFQVDGRDVGLEDIADGFALAETQPGDIVDGAGDEAPPAEGDGLPTPDEVADTAEQEARDAAGAVAAEAIDSGRARYLELYTDTLWMGVAGATAAAVLLSTILAPRSFALSLLLGFRTLAGLATVAAAGAHGVALWVVFSGRGAPDPAWAVWLGVGGLAGVLLGCIIGPKR